MIKASSLRKSAYQIVRVDIQVLSVVVLHLYRAFLFPLLRILRLSSSLLILHIHSQKKILSRTLKGSSALHCAGTFKGSR